MMKPCGKDGDMATAFALYEEAVAKGVSMHADLFNTLIVVCTQAKDFEAAESIFNVMRDKGVKPKRATYLQFIYAAFRLRRPDKAYDMLLNMENEWRVPDAHEYSRMLSLFRWAEHDEGKMRCLKGLMEDVKMGGNLAGVDKEIIANLFKDAKEKRRPDDVVGLAHVLKESGVPLDRYQKVGLAYAHLHLNQPVPAFATLIEYFEAGSRLSEAARDGIAELLALQATSVDEAYFLLEQRKQEGLPVPLPAVNMIIEACAVLGDLDRAFATWAEIEQLGLKPDTGTFNALLHTCIRTRELASGRRLLSRMTADGLKADATTYTHQVSLHLMSRESEQAGKLLQKAKDEGVKPSAKMYAHLIIDAVRGRKGERAQMLLKQMEEDGHKPGNGLRGRVAQAGK
jgi:pentatricopeptide repeat protein